MDTVDFKPDVPLQTFGGGEYQEYERYSPDKEWMPRLVLDRQEFLCLARTAFHGNMDAGSRLLIKSRMKNSIYLQRSRLHGSMADRSVGTLARQPKDQTTHG